MFSFENYLQHGAATLKQMNDRISNLQNSNSNGVNESNLAKHSFKESSPPLLNIPKIIKHYGPFPPYSTIMGICADGVPLVLNLTHSAAGAILVLGDSKSGKTRLTRSILQASIQLNTPEQVSTIVIADNAAEYESLLKSKHCKKVIEISERVSVQNTLSELVEIVDKRRYYSANGAAILLVVDALNFSMRNKNSPLFKLLYKLVKHGPRYRVWPILVSSADNAEKLNTRFLQSIKTFLIGYTNQDLSKIPNFDKEQVKSVTLDKGKAFKISHHDQWIYLWIGNFPNVHEVEGGRYANRNVMV